MYRTPGDAVGSDSRSLFRPIKTPCVFDPVELPVLCCSLLPVVQRPATTGVLYSCPLQNEGAVYERPPVPGSGAKKVRLG